MWNNESEKAYQAAAKLVAEQARERKEALAPLREALRMTSISYNIPEIASALAARADQIIEALRPFASVSPGDSKGPALPPGWVDCRGTGRPAWLLDTDSAEVLLMNGTTRELGKGVANWREDLVGIRLAAPWQLVTDLTVIPVGSYFRLGSGGSCRAEHRPAWAIWWKP